MFDWATISGAGRVVAVTVSVAAVLALTVAPGSAMTQDREYGVRVRADPAAVMLCHGFGCAFRTPVVLSSADRAALRRAFGGRHGTPARERQGIARAVAAFEARMGARVGFADDQPRNSDASLHDPTQLDCIDETNNTDVLLEVLEEMELLRHHSVGPRLRRGFFVSVHNSASVTERATGDIYAIDSWPTANGQPPEIVPKAIWQANGV
ncbi:MAG: hypothetical protein AAFX39_07000 [Pseudomonadota bacterium]